ncbi:MAG TPA: glycosyltransferase [Prolixibacteraceae bacterium]|nr:glycosyltransferase [Prolixibacteraceae bacterium]
MEINTVAFLTSAHSPFDDRIFYHQAKSVSKRFKVVVVSSTENVKKTVGNISIIGDNRYSSDKKKKIEFFNQTLIQFNPEIIVCSEPLPIFAAIKYKKKAHLDVKIIYDVTEWYPSKKNLDGLPFLKRILSFFSLLSFNLYTSSHCDGFIFGEYYKSLPFRFLFQRKKWAIISYFPDLKYINHQKSMLIPGRICLGYTGNISIEKGIKSFFDVATIVKTRNPDVAVKLKIIGSCISDKEKEIFEKLCRAAVDIDIELLERQNFEQFSDELVGIDILFDLRKVDFENNHCLAIKVFYYAACGKPVIYSDIKAIRREIDVNQFGHFVNPDHSEKIADYVTEYMKNPDLYVKHSQAARKLAETNYNWGIIEPLFLDFIYMFQT